MNLQRLEFEIEDSSGSDIDYPPQQLLVNKYSPFLKGWQSEKFPYPN